MFSNLNVLNSAPSSLSFLKILNGISKTLGIARQVIPIYREIHPIIKKVPNVIKKIGTFQNKYIYNEQTNNAAQTLINTRVLSKVNNQSSPTFFQ